MLEDLKKNNSTARINMIKILHYLCSLIPKTRSGSPHKQVFNTELSSELCMAVFHGSVGILFSQMSNSQGTPRTPNGQALAIHFCPLACHIP